jgi:CO dehydrogenase/acetyl-CoA synthase delta subunit
MPIIAFIGEESYKAKEAKSNTFSEFWGEFEERQAMWEISGATAMISAGANIVVVWNEKSIETLKGLQKWN